jgi:thiol-disulfide isomerase/thioredoxin
MKSICFACLLLGVLVLGAYPAQAQDSDTAELEKRIQALETKIANLEQSLSQQLAALEKKMSQATPGAHPLEGEAQQAYTQISRLASEGKMEEAKTEMAAFMKKYSATQTAQRARRLNAELEVVGKTAPAEWGIEKWYQGESDVDLASDKTTLLVFWESWCPHCQREVPKMQGIATEMGAALQVVGLTRITKSSTEEKVQAFIEEQEVGYPMAKEDGSISRYFNVSGIPAAAVVKDGKIIWRGHPARLSSTMLKSWL